MRPLCSWGCAGSGRKSGLRLRKEKVGQLEVLRECGRGSRHTNELGSRCRFRFWCVDRWPFANGLLRLESFPDFVRRLPKRKIAIELFRLNLGL